MFQFVRKIVIKHLLKERPKIQILNGELFVVDPDTPLRISAGGSSETAFKRGRGNEKYFQVAILNENKKPIYGLINAVGDKIRAYVFDPTDTSQPSRKLEDCPQTELEFYRVLQEPRLAVMMFWVGGFTHFESLEEYFWWTVSPKQRFDRWWDQVAQRRFNKNPPKFVSLDRVRKELFRLRDQSIDDRQTYLRNHSSKGFSSRSVATSIYGDRIWRLPDQKYDRYMRKTEMQFHDLVVAEDVKPVPNEIDLYTFHKLAISGKDMSPWDIMIGISAVDAALVPSVDMMIRDGAPHWIMWVLVGINAALVVYGLKKKHLE